MNAQQQDWFPPKEIERIEQAQAAIDKWKPRLEIIKSNPPRYTRAYIEGRI